MRATAVRKGHMLKTYGCLTVSLFEEHIMRQLGCLTVSFLMVVTVAGCVTQSVRPSVALSCSQEVPDPSGSWSGPDWGTVTLEGLSGTYTGSYGRAATTIELKWTGGRSFVGTWREGTFRSGWLQMTLTGDGAECSGTWGADESCEHRPGSPRSAAFTWRRVR